MRVLFISLLLIVSVWAGAQPADSLNTASLCSYMKSEERDMIYEINRVRDNPRSYLPYIVPLLDMEKKMLKSAGKGDRHYSLTYRTTTIIGKATYKTDTTWFYEREERVKALASLVDDLKQLKKRPVLLPDSGIYNAAQKHTADNNNHQWKLLHTGSDGSMPWDRILLFAPSMTDGNENIAGRYPNVSAREIVIQLLIDEGISSYGHRYNLLNPQWTHVACVAGGLKERMYRWVQNFGSVKKANVDR